MGLLSFKLSIVIYFSSVVKPHHLSLRLQTENEKICKNQIRNVNVNILPFFLLILKTNDRSPLHTGSSNLETGLLED